MQRFSPPGQARWRAAVLFACALAALTGCTPQAESKPSDPRPDPATSLLERAKATWCALLRTCPPAKTAKGGGARRGRARRTHLVDLATVGVDTLRLTRVYTGSLRSRRMVRVFNQEEGRVTALPFYEGDVVAADAVLLTLDNTLLRAQLDKAVAVRKEAATNRQRIARLGKSQHVSGDEVSRAEMAADVAKADERVLRARLGYMTVHAPFAGIISARRAEVGDIVPRHTHVMSLIDPSSLVTELAVSELLLPFLSVGDTVTVRIDALGDRALPGVVLRLHPELDPLTRLGRIEIELKPVPDGAQAGQFARVTFTTEARDRKNIPFSALRRDRDGEYVFRLIEGNRAKRAAVRSGRRLADRVEILEGLAAGERIVTKGFLGLTDGKQVQPVGERPMGGKGQSGDRAREKGKGKGKREGKSAAGGARPAPAGEGKRRQSG